MIQSIEIPKTHTFKVVREAVRTSIRQISEAENIPESDAKSQLLRPSLAYVVAQELGVSRSHEGFLQAMTASQVIHEASLYHDDVIDEGKYRRGKPTLPRQVGNRIAVMQGDRFIAAAFKLMAGSESIGLMKDFAKTIESIINGEVLQNKNIGKLISWETYQQINAMKTGELFAFAMRIPFYFLPVQEESRMARVGQLGLSLGAFYQYIDDFLDYNLFSTSGKPPYQDFKSQKWTLIPHFVENFSWEGGLSEFWQANYAIKSANKGDGNSLRELKLHSPLQMASDFLVKGLSALQEEFKQEFTEAQALLELLETWKAKILSSQLKEQTLCLKAVQDSPSKSLPDKETLQKRLYEFLADTVRSQEKSQEQIATINS